MTHGPHEQPHHAPESGQSHPHGYAPQDDYTVPAYQPAPGAYYPPPPTRNTDGLAIAAMALSGLGPGTCMLTAIPGIICGHIALSRVKRGEGGNRGLALGGVVCGYVGLGAILLFALFYVVVMVAAASA